MNKFVPEYDVRLVAPATPAKIRKWRPGTTPGGRTVLILAILK